MNEKYLRGYFETYVQPSRKDATYESWVSKIKDNDEYKRGMFETNVLPSKADATYDDWNAKVFGGAPVKKKEPSAPAVAGGAKASQNVPTQQPAPALRGPAGLGQGSKQASPSTSKSTFVSDVGPDGQSLIPQAWVEKGEAQTERDAFLSKALRAEKEYLALTSGQRPSYVKPDVLTEVKKAGAFNERTFNQYLDDVKTKNNILEKELQSLKDSYSQEYVTQRVKDIASNDPAFKKAESEILNKYKALVETATDQSQVDQYVAQADAEFQEVYDVVKEKALDVIDKEFEAKVKETVKKNSAGTDLIEKSGLRPYLDEIVNDENFNTLSFDKKQNILKAMYGLLGNELARKDSGDAATLLKLKNQLDENYLQKFYYDKKQALSPFAIKQYAEGQIPDIQKKVDELKALYKSQQQSGNMAGGFYTNPETMETMPTGEAIVKYEDALDNLQKIIELPDDKGLSPFSDFAKGFFSTSGMEKMPFAGTLINFGKAASLYGSATSERQSEADRALLQTTAMLQDYENKTKDLRSISYDVGVSTANTLPALGEFALTAGVGSGTVRTMEKIAEKEIVDYGESKARKFLFKPFFETIGVLAQTTANPQQIALNTVNRMTPEMKLAMGPEGDRLVAIVDQNSGESFDEAFLKAYGITAIEFFTEKAGGAIPFYTKGMVGKAAKNSPEFIKRAYIAFYMRKTGMSPSKAYEVFKKLGWNGLLPETIEEVSIIPLENFITGDYKDPRLGPYSSILNGITDPKTGELDYRNLKTIVGSVAAVSVPMAGIGIAMSNLPKGRTEVRFSDINGNERNVKIQTSVLKEIKARAREGGDSLREFLNKRLPELSLDMNERYVAVNIVDSLLNQNSQQRLGGNISESDKAIIDELDKLDLEAVAEAEPEEVAPTEAAPEGEGGAAGMAMVRSINELKAEVELMKQGKETPEKAAKIAEFEKEIAEQESLGIDPDKGRVVPAELAPETMPQAAPSAPSPEKVGGETTPRPELANVKSTTVAFDTLQPNMPEGSPERIAFANKISALEDLAKYTKEEYKRRLNVVTQSDVHELISEKYHKAKADGSNPELVKAVEELFAAPQATPATEVTPEAAPSAPSPEAGSVAGGEVDLGVLNEAKAFEPNQQPDITDIVMNTDVLFTTNEKGEKLLEGEGSLQELRDVIKDNPKVKVRLIEVRKDGDITAITVRAGGETTVYKVDTKAVEQSLQTTTQAAPSVPSPEATQTAEVNRQAVRVFEEISPLLDARKGADVKNKRDINKAISEKIKSNPKADFIYTNWNKLKKQLKFEHEGNCP